MNNKTPLRFPKNANPFAKKSDTSRDLTSDRIAEHMDAFQAAGGTVEVLGTTRVLKQIAQSVEDAAAKA